MNSSANAGIAGAAEILGKEKDSNVGGVKQWSYPTPYVRYYHQMAVARENICRNSVRCVKSWVVTAEML